LTRDQTTLVHLTGWFFVCMHLLVDVCAILTDRSCYVSLDLCLYAAPAGAGRHLRWPRTETLTVITHDSFNVSEDVLAAFEQETGIRVEFLRLGDAGVMLNQSILSQANPLGDVLFRGG
jgi:ABC-type thiamine transport system substrate-binding protein